MRKTWKGGWHILMLWYMATIFGEIVMRFILILFSSFNNMQSERLYFLLCYKFLSVVIFINYDILRSIKSVNFHALWKDIFKKYYNECIDTWIYKRIMIPCSIFLIWFYTWICYLNPSRLNLSVFTLGAQMRV